MRVVIFNSILLFVICCLLSGCGSNVGVAIINASKRPDTDVTSLPQYNFISFAGTSWKTKVKTALADIKTYSGEHQTTLLTPESFDTKHPKYRPPSHLEKVIVELPIGTKLRIERLMKDNGNWGGVRVTASLEDGRVVFLLPEMLSKNCFVWEGWSDSKEWDGDPDILKKVEK